MKLRFFKKITSNNTARADEETRVEGLIERFKENPKAWEEQKMGAPGDVSRVILSRILGTIDESHRQTRLLKRSISIAASIIMILGGAWLGFHFYMKSNSFKPEDLIVRTSVNEIKKLTLSDGSLVWLNEGSVLSYPKEFLGEKREVELLDGEAFFDVAHDGEKPFQVKAGGTITNVLGTAFNISAYSWLQTINVTVNRGKVAVNNALLLPDQQVEYDKASGKLNHKKLQASAVSSWMDGKLAFNDQNFKTVASILEKKFNVSIRFASKSLEVIHFTAQFEKADSLDDILTALTLTMGLNYTTKGNTIVIAN